MINNFRQEIQKFKVFMLIEIFKIFFISHEPLSKFGDVIKNFMFYIFKNFKLN